MSTQTQGQTTALAEQAKAIDSLALKAAELFGQATNFQQELEVANAMQQLRQALTPEVMAPIMELMNTSIGFKTDRDPKRARQGEVIKPYSVEVVRDVFIEAKLRGFHALGNEFNIIAGGFYAARNGLERKVKTWPGVTDVKPVIGVPKLAGEKGAIVTCRITWKRDRVSDSLDVEIPVKIDSYTGVDAIIGKAERKLYKRVHDILSGKPTDDGDADDEPAQLANNSGAAAGSGGSETQASEVKASPVPAAPAQSVATEQLPQKTVVAPGQSFAPSAGQPGPSDSQAAPSGPNQPWVQPQFTTPMADVAKVSQNPSAPTASVRQKPAAVQEAVAQMSPQERLAKGCTENGIKFDQVRTWAAQLG